ncbi:PAS domain-containing sensor histidine kinase [Dictyobacter alpinus]|uniref:PAS domain-containing sensor histidine kinase n=1 Tax=Dictyobacter alpinus TaxID=2014873 RepID=UPI000F82F7D2|nr:PAS domain S-box protein [Dictyobacter alpinus]
MESDHLAFSRHDQVAEEQQMYLQADNISLFLALAQDSAAVFWLLTSDGHFENTYTHSWKNFTGQEDGCYAGPDWLQSIHPLDRIETHAAFLQSVASHHSTETECHLHRHDGSYPLLRLRYIPVPKTDGSIAQVIVLGQEISDNERRKMGEEQMHLALAAANIGLCDWDIRIDVLTLTDQCKMLFGFSTHETVSYEQLMAAVHPDDLTQRDQAIQEALVAKSEYSVDYRIIHPNQTTHWLTVRGRWLYDGQGFPVRMIAAVMDITALKRAEAQQSQAASKLTTVLESISDAFFMIDTQWRYTYANSHAEELLGKKLPDLIGQHIEEVTPTFADSFFHLKFQQAFKTQQAQHFEAFSLPQKKWFELHAYPSSEGLSVYYQDITERKRVDRALRESEMKFRRFVESNIIGVLVVDIYGNIYEANQAYLSITGYTNEEITAGKLQWTAMTVPDSLPRQAQAIEEFLATGVSKPFELTIHNKENKPVPIMMAIAQLKSSSTLGVAIVLDISARKEVEQQKDVFLSIASHELRTPLTVIKGSLQLIQRRMKRMASLPEAHSPAIKTAQNKNAEDLAHALHQIDAQSRLVNDLLDVTRITVDKLELKMQRFDLVKLIHDTVDDLRSTTPTRSLKLLVSPKKSLYVVADPDRIAQVISNYVTNAIKYSDPERPIRIGMHYNEDVARVWVQDKGPGLSEDARKQIWKRFYQLKESSTSSDNKQGLGLGLYICQTIIQQHHGEVGVDSIPGKGSTFWFTLPLKAE